MEFKLGGFYENITYVPGTIWMCAGFRDGVPLFSIAGYFVSTHFVIDHSLDVVEVYGWQRMKECSPAALTLIGEAIARQAKAVA